MEPILECKNINYSYHSMAGETPALRNISFRLDKGEFLSIVGPSGCGKSTLLSLLCGLLAPESGEVLYMGQKISADKRQQFGYMLQKDHLFEWRSIRQDVLLGLEIQKKAHPKDCPIC